MTVNPSERAQQEHYDAIAPAYETHYSDRWSREFRDRYVLSPLCEGIQLPGRSVLDAMCGSGQAAGFFVAAGCDVTGLDISPSVLALLCHNHPAVTAVCASILDSRLPSESFDLVVVHGGLHHVHPHVEPAVDEIFRLLKPGGHLLFAEPVAGSIFDWLRKRWYRVDGMFATNEASIDVGELIDANRHRFQVEIVRFGGNLAYLLVYNSMIFRIPHFLKRFYAPPVLALEGLLQHFQRQRTACMVISRWRKGLEL